jgi:hypothetical protein
VPETALKWQAILSKISANMFSFLYIVTHFLTYFYTVYWLVDRSFTCLFTCLLLKTQKKLRIF